MKQCMNISISNLKNAGVCLPAQNEVQDNVLGCGGETWEGGFFKLLNTTLCLPFCQLGQLS